MPSAKTGAKPTDFDRIVEGLEVAICIVRARAGQRYESWQRHGGMSDFHASRELHSAAADIEELIPKYESEAEDK